MADRYLQTFASDFRVQYPTQQLHVDDNGPFTAFPQVTDGIHSFSSDSTENKADQGSRKNGVL